MNNSPQALDPRFQQMIDQHVDAVEAVLGRGGMGRAERRCIIDNLELQILDMLNARSTTPTETDVREVLSRLDPPEAFADSKSIPSPACLQPHAPAEFSKAAIIGAFWISLFFIGFLLFSFYRYETKPGVPLPSVSWSIYTMRFIVLLGAFAPFGTTILGWVSVAQIRHSNGKLYGMGLALADGLVFPLLLLDALILQVWLYFYKTSPFFHFAGGYSGQGLLTAKLLALSLLILTIILIYIVDALIIRRCWQAVNRPL